MPTPDLTERLRPAGPWGLAALPPLSDQAVAAVMDLPRAWYERRAWQAGPGVDPEHLLAVLQGHGLAGALGSLALDGRVDQPALASAGRHHYFSSLLHHQQAMQAARQVMDAAISAGIEVVFVKGPVLAAGAYGDPGVRGFSDLDVLVVSASAGRALAAALGGKQRPEAAGRRLDQPGRLFAKVSGWPVEIAFPAPAGSALGDLQRRLGARMLRPAPGEGLPGPEPTVHALLLFEHLARHLGERLVWFLDLAVLARRSGREVDWSEVEAHLGRLGLLGVAGVIARFCRHHLDPRFPRVGDGRLAGPSCEGLFAPACIVNGFAAQAGRRGRWGRFCAYHVAHSLRHVLVGDPEVASTQAARWAATALLDQVGLHSGPATRSLAAVVEVVSRVGSRIAVRGAGLP